MHLHVVEFNNTMFQILELSHIYIMEGIFEPVEPAMTEILTCSLSFSLIAHACLIYPLVTP
jgi:hypothetical protein